MHIVCCGLKQKEPFDVLAIFIDISRRYTMYPSLMRIMYFMLCGVEDSVLSLNCSFHVRRPQIGQLYVAMNLPIVLNEMDDGCGFSEWQIVWTMECG